MNKYKYKLILCEHHNPLIHGKTNDSDPYIENYIIVIDSFTLNNIKKYIKMYKRLYQQYNYHLLLNNHPSIRNYKNIILNNNYIKPEIAQCITLVTGETIAILKTFWIRIIQKTWKNIFKKRLNIIKQWKTNPILLWERDLGKRNFSLPGLRGMLKLNKRS
jgi:hypothetical protein